jgi:hypothetical protein
VAFAVDLALQTVIRGNKVVRERGSLTRKIKLRVSPGITGSLKNGEHTFHPCHIRFHPSQFLIFSHTPGELAFPSGDTKVGTYPPVLEMRRGREHDQIGACDKMTEWFGGKVEASLALLIGDTGRTLYAVIVDADSDSRGTNPRSWRGRKLACRVNAGRSDQSRDHERVLLNLRMQRVEARALAIRLAR